MIRLNVKITTTYVYGTKILPGKLLLLGPVFRDEPPALSKSSLALDSRRVMEPVMDDKLELVEAFLCGCWFKFWLVPLRIVAGGLMRASPPCPGGT